MQNQHNSSQVACCLRGHYSETTTLPLPQHSSILFPCSWLEDRTWREKKLKIQIVVFCAVTVCGYCFGGMCCLHSVGHWYPSTRLQHHNLEYERGLISLRLYKENNKLRDWKKCIYSSYSPSSTHIWLRCSNFFNPPKKNSFGCAANRKTGNRKTQRLISTPYTPYVPSSQYLPPRNPENSQLRNADFKTQQ
jgi:hypothetical protein